MNPITVQMSYKFNGLREPHRYKVLYGGRGGGKSWAVAITLITEGANRPIRVGCARETYSSIQQSVHQLLCDVIRMLGLGDFYTIQEREIRGKNGTEFFYMGLDAGDPDKMKGLENVDYLWIEEAANVTKGSYEAIGPTIRKAGSEIWIVFNPKYSADETYQRFVIRTPPNTWRQQVSYLDNPFLSEESLNEARYCLETYGQDEYDHIWGGRPKSNIAGGVYAAELKIATAEGRIGHVPYNRTYPVHTSWDIGQDRTVCWFFQQYSGMTHCIDYFEAEGGTFQDHIHTMQSRRYLAGLCYLPWDASSVRTHRKSLGVNYTMSPSQIFQAAGCVVIMNPERGVDAGINNARILLSQTRFDSIKCVVGLNGLANYAWGEKDKGGNNPRKPIHNWASHAADAFRGIGEAVQVFAPPRAGGYDIYTDSDSSSSGGRLNTPDGWML